ncbi:efflux RND transporter periplasmic adaptor subunit [Succinimonas amylolytica]|uniref:efflux RND transporter periplasmic adaptor subunit n=1 Tax=Succinimonas amylolytica TaxID=83769 RepID=UPI0003A138FC|nr:efflux RND transporter periplasmic adaptor subunit [Succinimonas amylolytica]
MHISARKQFYTLLMGLLTITGLTACGDNKQNNSMGDNSAPPPMPVDFETVKTESVPVVSNLTGRTVAVRTAEVRPQVSGVILRRLFKEGTTVQEGQQLYQIDPAMYEAQLASAKANLAQAQAQENSARMRYNRYSQLITTNAISKQDYDDAEANYNSAKAGSLAAASAVKTAEINLAYTKVYAPITGVISRSNITEGALVTTGQLQALATIQQLDPMYLDLGQSVNDHIFLKKNIKNGTFNPNTEDNQVKVFLENGEAYEHKAKLEFSEVTVDESTGMVNVRAIVPNPDQILLPGMYVRAEINEGSQQNATVIPQIAVMRQTNGTSIIYTISPENTVQQHVITITSEFDNKYVVKSDVKAGDRVITSNLQKIGPQSPVTPLETKTDTTQSNTDLK